MSAFAEADDKPPSNFLRFLQYVRPYKFYVLAAAIGGIVKFSVPLLIPEVTRRLINNVFLNEAMTQQEKIDQLLSYAGGLILVFIFIWGPFTFLRHYYSGKAGHRSVFDLRCDLYDRILRMSASFFDRNQSGAIVARLISDIELAKKLVGSALTNIWMDMISLVLILAFLLNIDFGITVVSLITFPIYIALFRMFRDRIRDASHQVQEEIAQMSGNVQEKIVGSQVVHAFTQERNEEKHFLSESNKLLSTTMRRVQLQSVNMALTGMIVNSAPLIVMLYGGYRVITGSLAIGDLVAVTMWLKSLYTPLQRFSELNVVFSNSMAALDRVFEIMDEKPEVRDRPNAIDLKDTTGYVEFHDVHFAYEYDDDDEEQEEGPVLRGISFAVEPGQKVAMVGPSGAGKSTAVSLIPRFYDVTKGSVMVDGYDVRDLKVRSLRRHVGMVLQTPILFSGTVWDNIRYGKPDASTSEIIAAAKAANAYDFIMNLPKGFDSEVGEGGAFLSGGQRQRVTIARAFLKDPRILILDEATSSLDSESEKLIQESLERLMQGRTTFIIAHRLSTIENADRILVFDSGHLVETGTHRQLLHSNGVYERLYNHSA